MTVVNSWADRHWKSVLGIAAAAVVTWYGLVEQVANKVDKPDLAAVKTQLNTLTRDVQDLSSDMSMVVRYICQNEPASLGCQERNRGRRDDR